MILITGDKGYIGDHLRSRLPEASGYDLRDGYDIRNLYDLDIAFERSQPDTVIHLAALAGVRQSRLYPDQYVTTNVTGTWNVGKMCEKYGYRLISFSSSSVFGNSNPPTKETDPKNPLSLYGITKLAGENIVNRLECQTTIIRPFTLFPGRETQVWGKWEAQYRNGKEITVFGDGVRGYVHIDDLTDAIVHLVESKWVWDHEDFNLGGGDVVQITDLLDMFLSHYSDAKVKMMIRPTEDIAVQYADITKAKEMLNYNPKFSFKRDLMKVAA